MPNISAISIESWEMFDKLSQDTPISQTALDYVPAELPSSRAGAAAIDRGTDRQPTTSWELRSLSAERG